MTFRKCVAVTVLAGLAVALALPADAATKRKTKKSYIYYGSEDRYYGPQGKPGRAATRVTVRPRSYLDPGTETKQYDQHYTDYAFPPGGSWSYQNRNDYGITWTRAPLPDPWDIPGWPKY